jgi:hypothetical protein
VRLHAPVHAVDDLRQRGLRRRLDNEVLAEQVDIEARPDRLEQRRLVDLDVRRRPRGQQRLDDLERDILGRVLPDKACADGVDHLINELAVALEDPVPSQHAVCDLLLQPIERRGLDARGSGVLACLAEDMEIAVAERRPARCRARFRDGARLICAHGHFSFCSSFA